MEFIVKICGITQPDQGRAIAEAGATMLGFICVPASPRYITPEKIAGIVATLPVHAESGTCSCDRVGVFVDASLEQIQATVEIAGLNVVQLHGNESLEFCRQLRTNLPEIKQIRALRVRSATVLSEAMLYQPHVDLLLLDAYHPTLAGGTGKTLDWRSLQSFYPAIPWLLAGGLTPANIKDALSEIQPNGVDLSSGVEQTPGIKDMEKVTQLFAVLKEFKKFPEKTRR